MNRSYTVHTGENTQAPIPWIVGKAPACEVYKDPDKVTISDLIWNLLNQQVLALVYKKRILVTMSDQNEKKLNRLLALLGDNVVVYSRWLRTHGYYSILMDRYGAIGLLVSLF